MALCIVCKCTMSLIIDEQNVSSFSLHSSWGKLMSSSLVVASAH